MIESPVGRHVDDFKVGSWLRVKFPVSLAPCSLTDSQIHGLIKTGRFFENPLVGRHVLNVGPKKGVNLSFER
jgi:hypothetical protein